MALVVQDERLSTPGRVPVAGGVEIEDVRSELALGIAVRGDGAAHRNVVPVEAQPQEPPAKHSPEKAAVALAAKLADEFPPGLGDLETLVVVQGVTVMGQLAVRTGNSEIGSETGDFRQGGQEPLVSSLSQEAFRVHPR